MVDYKLTHTKPKRFKRPAFNVWADSVFIKKGEICIYFNSAEVYHYATLSIDELQTFERTLKILAKLYERCTNEDQKTIQSHIWEITGRLFRMGVINVQVSNL